MHVFVHTHSRVFDQKYKTLDTNLFSLDHLARDVLMGEGNVVASVTMLTFTKRPGPHADTAWAVVG